MQKHFLDVHYTREVKDLGDLSPRHRGIFSPRYADADVARYIHQQFTDDAAAYASRYGNTDYFKWLLTNAFARLRPGVADEELDILDLGSGSGNSVFPLLELCARARVIASDLSLELLGMLAQGLAAKSLLGRCALLQLNAEQLDFKPESFDLVVGAAILHHLFEPARVLEGTAKILKPGGAAIFFEPFESGNILLRLAYGDILDDPRAPALEKPLVDFLKLISADFEMRQGRDKSGPIFQRVDDKWLFTRRYFEELAERCGFSRVTVHPLTAAERMFENQTTTYLRLGAGLSPQAMPEWAWEKVRRLDRALSEDVRSELLIEGCVIFHR